MSTPTPSTATQPSSASKKATDHVTTPSRLGLASPAPRSIPSPAATRKEQSGKTPTNHPTVSSIGSSKTLGGTPMVQSLSQTGLTTSLSPGAHNAGFTPSALGLGVDMGSGTPGLNMPTPMAGSIGMAHTLSELGLAPSGGSKRNEDEDRRIKMRKVLKSIGRRKGRASKDGLDRIARRIGLETSIDPREVTMAGQKTMVVINYKESTLQDVTAAVYDDNGKELKEYQAPIGGVLLRDLAVPDGILLRSNLDRFAVNLDRLARMDRLSADVSCFAAMHGLYKSLNKLHELERKALAEFRKDANNAEAQAQHEAMRKRSGRPILHGRNQVGLTLDYWSTEESTWEPERDSSAMDVDGNGADDDADHGSEIFSLRIEAEGAPAAMYPSLRVSDAWLPDTFALPGPDSLEGILWNNPPPTYIPHKSQDGDMALDDSQRLPNLRFVAKLDPPIVMPYQNAMNILSAVGAPPHQVFGVLSYDAMLLGKAETTQQSTQQADRTVLVVQNGEELEVPHHYNLDVSKAEYGYKLEEIPFSHPRQIVELLPMLRQWAHTGGLVQNVMKMEHTVGKAVTNGAERTNGHSAADLTMANLLAASSTTPDTLNVDIELTTSPQPTLSISYANSDESDVSSVTVQIMANAEIMVTNYEGFENGDEDGKSDAEAGTSQAETAKKLAKAFAICGDLGTFVEWQRRNGRKT